jgi:hypothetical protein
MIEPTIHIRLPQRADAVGGIEQQPGKLVPPKSVPDQRIVSQDPAKTPHKVQKEENALIAELDQGPLMA